MTYLVEPADPKNFRLVYTDKERFCTRECESIRKSNRLVSCERCFRRYAKVHKTYMKLVVHGGLAVVNGRMGVKNYAEEQR